MRCPGDSRGWGHEGAALSTYVPLAVSQPPLRLAELCKRTGPPSRSAVRRGLPNPHPCTRKLAQKPLTQGLSQSTQLGLRSDWATSGPCSTPTLQAIPPPLMPGLGGAYQTIPSLIRTPSRLLGTTKYRARPSVSPAGLWCLLLSGWPTAGTVARLSGQQPRKSTLGVLLG